MINKPIIGYVLKSAIRDRLIAAVLCTLIVGLSISIFMGSSAISESDQFTFVFASSALRFIGVVGIILFTVFYVSRMYERKDIDYLLSRPLGRGSFIVSHAIAFMIIASFIALAISAIMLAITAGSVLESTLYWCLGLWFELLLAAVTAMFFSMVLTSPASGTMATIGLYVLGRMMGSLLGIVHTGVEIPGGALLAFLMKVVSIIVPRYDLLVQSGWLVYGEAGFTAIMALHGIALLLLYITASWLDLRRKQF